MSNDINKISVTEAFNNPGGKTSSNKLVGVTTSFVCLFLFVTLVIYYFINPSEAPNVLALIDKTTVYFSVAAGVMGIKTIASNFGGNRVVIGEMPQQNQQNFNKHDNRHDDRTRYDYDEPHHHNGEYERFEP